ncbi:AGAP011197-PA-like protein [Anopheles sinensis]|uniref:AGAP011197-PA-like protein n=1 Tax=Anopheles sinensis TaxID=74873 RepID=A0A084W3N1_ANOSI|nr:AGAP011197-PA-like protein [Anopheles sinensis]
MAKLDFLHTRQVQMDYGFKERDEELNEKLLNLENVFGWAGHNLTAIQELSRKILAQQIACANHDQMRKDIIELSVKQVDVVNAKLFANVSLPASKYNENGKNIQNRYIKSCMEAPVNASGGYWLQVNPTDRPLEVFCEQRTFGSGWLVIQNRYDGSLDFNRNWTDYRNGFGNVYKEHWIGLEKIYPLTSKRPHELIVEFKEYSTVCHIPSNTASYFTINSTEESGGGYGFGEMMAKLSQVQNKLHEIENGLKERDEVVLEKLTNLENSLEELNRHHQDEQKTAGVNQSQVDDTTTTEQILERTKEWVNGSSVDQP